MGQKTNKELAVELCGQYLNARAYGESTPAITKPDLDEMLNLFYQAVKDMPNDQEPTE